MAALGVGAVNNGPDVVGPTGCVLEPDPVVRGTGGRIDRLGADHARAVVGGVDRDHVVARAQVRVHLALNPAHVDIGGAYAGRGRLQCTGRADAENHIVGDPVLPVHGIVGIAQGRVGGRVGGGVELAGRVACTSPGIGEEHADRRVVVRDIARALGLGIEGDLLAAVHVALGPGGGEVGGIAGGGGRGDGEHDGGVVRRDLVVLVGRAALVGGAGDRLAG